MSNAPRKTQRPTTFPNGLQQPAGSARFGLDALLLGSFAARIFAAKGRDAEPVCDLGCGCGAALFAFLLSQPEARGLGAEREEILLAAARANADLLGLKERAQFTRADLREQAAPSPAVLSPWLGRLSLVMANPPWHEHASGRASPQHLKARAHMRRDNDFFCAAAARLLAYHGLFAAVIPARLLGQFHLACRSARLGLRQVLPVATRPDKGASRLLLLTQKDAKDDVDFLPQLRTQNENGGHTAEARLFCPWL